jgi:hypothetical protein
LKKRSTKRPSGFVREAETASTLKEGKFLVLFAKRTASG